MLVSVHAPPFTSFICLTKYDPHMIFSVTFLASLLTFHSGVYCRHMRFRAESHVAIGARRPCNTIEIGNNLTKPILKQTAAERVGLSYDPCISNEDCLAPRYCQQQDGKYYGCTNSTSCLCIPKRFTPCQNSSKCEEGEACFGTGLSPFICLSANQRTVPLDSIDAFKAGDGIHSVNSCPETHASLRHASSGGREPNWDAEVPSSSRSSISISSRANLQTICMSNDTGKCGDANCMADREAHSRSRTECCESSSPGCVCMRLNPPMCITTADCPDGEFCIRKGIEPRVCFGEHTAKFMSGTTGPPYTRIIGNESDDVVAHGQGASQPGPADEKENNVCISVIELSRHVRREHFIFPEDTKASVLCDPQGSCATPGHMVMFRGRPMRMSSYCLFVSCARRFMMVNSPKYKAKLSLPSSTNDLTYTGLAAKYDTVLEESILAVAIRLGM